MKRVRFGMGGVLMIAAMMISDRAEMIGIYMFSAALHELGHLIAAKLLKIEISEINFGFSGVRIVTEERLTSYKKELLLAMSGPLANILVFSAILVSSIIRKSGAEGMFAEFNGILSGGAMSLEGAASFLAISSLVQAIMNLLPVKTFDGGRILHCSMAELFGDRAAERAVEICSALSAFFLWTVALYLMIRVASGLGIYVFAACIFVSMISEDGVAAQNT